MRIIPSPAARGNAGRPDDPGFTLIELLAVVAVIGILIALLMPALSSARGASHTAACASNLRQIAIAHAVYADDHLGRLMPFGIAGTHAAQWTEVIAPYLQRGSLRGDSFNTATGGGEVFRCPSDTLPFPTLYGAAIGASHVGESAGWLSYAMNSGPVRFADGARNHAGVGGHRGEDLHQPSESMHHADVAYIRYIADVSFLFMHPMVGRRAMISLPDPRAHYTTPAPISAPAHKQSHERLMGDDALVYRHQRKMNLLYADGHAAVYQGPLPSAQDRPRFWGPIYQDIDPQLR